MKILVFAVLFSLIGLYQSEGDLYKQVQEILEINDLNLLTCKEISEKLIILNNAIQYVSSIDISETERILSYLPKLEVLINELEEQSANVKQNDQIDSFEQKEISAQRELKLEEMDYEQNKQDKKIQSLSDNAIKSVANLIEEMKENFKSVKISQDNWLESQGMEPMKQDNLIEFIQQSQKVNQAVTYEPISNEDEFQNFASNNTEQIINSENQEEKNSQESFQISTEEQQNPIIHQKINNENNENSNTQDLNKKEKEEIKTKNVGNGKKNYESYIFQKNEKKYKTQSEEQEINQQKTNQEIQDNNKEQEISEQKNNRQIPQNSYNENYSNNQESEISSQRKNNQMPQNENYNNNQKSEISSQRKNNQIPQNENYNNNQESEISSQRKNTQMPQNENYNNNQESEISSLRKNNQMPQNENYNNNQESQISSQRKNTQIPQNENYNNNQESEISSQRKNNQIPQNENYNNNQESEISSQRKNTQMPQNENYNNNQEQMPQNQNYNNNQESEISSQRKNNQMPQNENQNNNKQQLSNNSSVIQPKIQSDQKKIYKFFEGTQADPLKLNETQLKNSNYQKLTLISKNKGKTKTKNYVIDIDVISNIPEKKKKQSNSVQNLLSKHQQNKLKMQTKSPYSTINPFILQLDAQFQNLKTFMQQKKELYNLKTEILDVEEKLRNKEALQCKIQ